MPRVFRDVRDDADSWQPWVSGISNFTQGLDLGNPKKKGAKIDLIFYVLI